MLVMQHIVHVPTVGMSIVTSPSLCHKGGGHGPWYNFKNMISRDSWILGVKIQGLYNISPLLHYKRTFNAPVFGLGLTHSIFFLDNFA